MSFCATTSRPVSTTVCRVSSGLSRSRRLLPLLVVEAYLTCTVLLFRFGPWPWPVLDGTKLYLFLFASQAALAGGYLTKAFGQPRAYTGRLSVSRLVSLSVAANLLLLVPTSLTRTGSYSFNLLDGILNPGDAYARSFLLRSEGIPVAEYFRIFLAPLLGLLLPLTVFYWTRLRFSLKALSVIYHLCLIALFVGMGTNKAIADLFLQLPCLIIAGAMSGIFRVNLKRAVGSLVLVALMTVGFTLFFAATQSSRVGSSSRYGYITKVNLRADREWMGIANLPEEVQTGILGVSSYATQGYYALYLCLDKPFVPMFGVGNSMFLYRQASRLLNMPDLVYQPYPVRIELDGTWDSFTLWSSIYPWIASDVSFPGTILVVFLIGRLLAMCWLDMLGGMNPFAVTMFSYFVIMLAYFSANNQCLQGGEGLCAFFVTLCAWLWTRSRGRQSYVE